MILYEECECDNFIRPIFNLLGLREVALLFSSKNIERKNLVTSGFPHESKNVFEGLTLYRPTHMRMNRLLYRIVQSRSTLEFKGPHHGEKCNTLRNHSEGIREMNQRAYEDIWNTQPSQGSYAGKRVDAMDHERFADALR